MQFALALLMTVPGGTGAGEGQNHEVAYQEEGELCQVDSHSMRFPDTLHEDQQQGNYIL
jgi:hypothetical protein